MRHLRYLLGRLLQVTPVLLLIVVANFFLLRLAPGDLVDVMAGEAGAATPEFVAALRAQFGSDLPAWQQLANYLIRVTQGDLGYSHRHGHSVGQLIGSRLPATVLLVGVALLVSLVAGVALGWLAAAARRRWLARLASLGSTVGFATPLFWVGLMLIVLFAIELRWLPTGGLIDLDAEYQGMAYALDLARHLFMPVTTLAIFYIAVYARLTEVAVREVLRADHVRTARAKGLPSGRITRMHVLRNALLPVVTVTGMQIGALLGGSVVVETVFSWPGMGRLAFDAVMQRDLNLLLGILLCTSVMVIVANLLTDLLYAWLDPRIELA